MTGEPAHSTLDERMAPALLFSSKHVPQLSITEIAKWPLLHFELYMFSHYTVLREHYQDLYNQSSHNGKLV